MRAITGQSRHLRYNLGLAIGAPLLAAYLANRYLSGKSRPGWRERWGSLPSALRAGREGAPCIWTHAVSAGEVVALTPILRELRGLLPHYELLLSVITPAGHEMAEKQASPYLDALIYAPFDLPWVVRRVVQQIRPQVFVTAESELWPNLLHELKRQGARTVMVNGRITDRSFARIRKFARSTFRWMLSNMDLLLMQSSGDAERIRLLGDGAGSERVRVVGNSKFDQKIAPLSSEEQAAMRRDLHLPPDAPVFAAGSTRSVEEDRIVLQAYLSMRSSLPDLCLITAPRQIARASEVCEAMRQAKLEPVLRTQVDRAAGEVRHLVLDTMGELAQIYAVADLVFIGNSFPPVVQGGGQNLIQPLAHGKPVLVGPHIATIRAEAALGREAGVVFQAADGAALAHEGLRLLQDENLRREIAAKAKHLIEINRGVSAEYARAVAELAQV